MNKHAIKEQLNRVLNRISDSISCTYGNIWFTENGRMILFGLKFYNNSSLKYDGVLTPSSNERYIEFVSEYKDTISTITDDIVSDNFLNSIYNNYYRNKNSGHKTKYIWNLKTLQEYISTANQLSALEQSIRSERSIDTYVNIIKPLIKATRIYKLSPEYNNDDMLTHIEMESKFITLDILYEFDYLNFSMACHVAIYSKIHNKRREFLKVYHTDKYDIETIAKQSTIDIAKATVGHLYGLFI